MGYLQKMNTFKVFANLKRSLSKQSGSQAIIIQPELCFRNNFVSTWIIWEKTTCSRRLFQFWCQPRPILLTLYVKQTNQILSERILKLGCDCFEQPFSITDISKVFRLGKHGDKFHLILLGVHIFQNAASCYHPANSSQMYHSSQKGIFSVVFDVFVR